MEPPNHVIMNVPELAERVIAYVKDSCAIGCVNIDMFHMVASQRKVKVTRGVVDLLCDRREWGIINLCKVERAWPQSYVKAVGAITDERPRESDEWPSVDSWTAALQIYTAGFALYGQDKEHVMRWMPVPLHILRDILTQKYRKVRWGYAQYLTDKRIVRDVYAIRDLEVTRSTLELLTEYIPVPLNVYVALGWQWKFTEEDIHYVTDPDCLLDPELIRRLREDTEGLAATISIKVKLPRRIHKAWQAARIDYQ